MSSPERDPHLQRWLPQLDAYRMAINRSPDEIELAEWRKSGAEPTASLSVVSQPLASQIVHLPVDGILKRMAKAKSFVLGVGTVGNFESSVVRNLVTDIVERCCDKTQRKALLVTIRLSDFRASKAPAQSASFREAHWSYMGGGKSETKLWHSQLAELPLWKKDFGLIVFDLGDVCLPMMPRVGRLCDGIVVQMLNPANSRESINAMKSLQKERLHILGAWSVDFSARELAA